ncbi:hypothetical protein SEA_LILMAC1015_73 [Arthrobacter phage Lilmac1015]|uniref:Uncharacterized protein n=1 Tax=Arthrobacter phage Lilmac1015 TaxID=2912653 RepID=A0AA49BPK7_9CAUD|nr:hypothetical protein SEA_LILMAC1015_73 [Arthrobacter phage Lilmac1015]
MGVWIMASCDRDEACPDATTWYGDDADLRDDEGLARATLASVREYLTEYEEWAVVDGELLCPKCKPTETEETDSDD